MSLKSFVNNSSEYSAFLAELTDMIEKEHKSLEQSNDPVDMYRSQGFIAACKKLKKLRDKVNGQS